MQISGNSSVSVSESIIPTGAPSHHHRGHRAGTVQDSTNLSAGSVQAQQLKDSLSRLPEARPERVAAAIASLQDGKQPSADQLASAILNEYSRK